MYVKVAYDNFIINEDMMIWWWPWNLAQISSK